MFTECTIREIIQLLDLKGLNEVILSERGSLVLNGMEFKQNTLVFYVPCEKEFFKLTANPNAKPVNNFGLMDKQNFCISTKYGNVYFYNTRVDVDTNCNWDTHSKVYFFHEGYLRRYQGKREFY